MQEIKVYGSYTDEEKTVYMVELPILQKVEVGLEFIPVTTRGEYLYDPIQHLYAKLEKIQGNKLICTVYENQ